jgi:hypothetical protein
VKLLALVFTLALPAAVFAGEGALSQLKRQAGADAADSAAAAAPASSFAARPTGAVRFCAFSGGGRAAVQGELRAFSLEAPLGLAAAPDSPVPVSDRGVKSPQAVAKAKALLTEMLAQSPSSIAQSLGLHRVYLVIIPVDKKLTDLPEFVSLRGVSLPGGRIWDDVRGVGFVAQDDGTVAVAAGEENFLEGATPDGYPKGFLVAHEFSHAVHGYGLSDSDASAIAQAYRARETGHLEFPSRYASTDALEYFAVSASSFFGRTLSGKDPERPIDWIRQNDAAIFSVLGRAYGTPRPLWTRETAPAPGPVLAGATP